MLSKEKLRKLIYQRIKVCVESCNSYHQNHVQGQIRGMIAVLNDGKLPPVTEKTGDLYTAAGIPWTQIDNDTVCVPESWLEKHGLLK